MASLKLSKEEKQFLQNTCPYLNPVYLDFLEGFRYNPSEVHISQTGDQLAVEIEGLWYRTILWEVPLMSIICELYYVLNGAARISDEEILDQAKQKIQSYKKLGVTVAEFGTRRRYSYHVHRLVLQSLTAYCRGKIGMSFGIGTSLTNDAGPEPMNMVVKMTDALPQDGEWTEVVKLSDEPGKYTGSEKMINLAKVILGIT